MPGEGKMYESKGMNQVQRDEVRTEVKGKSSAWRDKGRESCVKGGYRKEEVESRNIISKGRSHEERNREY